MKAFEHETIIVTKDGWKFLRNLNRTTQGYSELTDEQLDRIWDNTTIKNNGANPKTHPISENEIRIDDYMFSIKWDKIKEIIYKNNLEWRKDGFMLTGIDI